MLNTRWIEDADPEDERQMDERESREAAATSREMELGFEEESMMNEIKLADDATCAQFKKMADESPTFIDWISWHFTDCEGAQQR